MFDKYKAKEITRIYMEKYAQLKRLLELKNHPQNIKDEDLKLDSLLNLYIEPTNRCNFNCIFCARENMDREFDMLNMDSFKKTINSLPKGTYITMTGHGEPTINVHIYEMIEYASSKGMFVSLITNASTLNKVNRERLINSGISRIQLSFEALDKKTNEAIMPGSVFERELLNMLKLIKEIRILKKSIYISISRVIIEQSKKFSEATKEFWEKMPIDNYYEGAWLSLQNESAMFENKFSDIDYRPCAIPWTDMQVNANGEVTACIQDWSSKCVIGNINDQSLMDILNNQKALQFRRAILTGDWDYLESIGYGGCKNCNTWTDEVNGDIKGTLNCSLMLRTGLVINEISGERPENIEFLEHAISVLESGETDLIQVLMNGEKNEEERNL